MVVIKVNFFIAIFILFSNDFLRILGSLGVSVSCFVDGGIHTPHWITFWFGKRSYMGQILRII